MAALRLLRPRRTLRDLLPLARKDFQRIRWVLFLSAGLLVGGTAFSAVPALPPGLVYTNYVSAKVPWSIHIAQVPRSNSLYELHSLHAGGGALGLSTLTTQIAAFNPALGTPVAAINGDFYQREKAFMGDPRGLQIVEGEVLAGPSGGVSFWVDALGEPHATNVFSRFEITLPEGVSIPFKLNVERGVNDVVLYTAAVGASTHTSGGRELILERQDGSPWLPLRIGRALRARVREIREGGNSPIPAGTLVLSLSPSVRGRCRNLAPGAVVQISTASAPSLRGIRTAISGGPMLLRRGKRQKIVAAPDEGYEFSSMLERHPRAGIGWNENCLLLVEVDGRQKELSVGMTLEEFSSFLLKLGCQEAMNFDGGGSATLWYQGEVKNSPCDGREREIANALLVARKRPKDGSGKAVR